MSVKYPDSVDKIIGYIERLREASEIKISDTLLRKHRCNICGGCCHIFSLDYFDGTERYGKFRRNAPLEYQQKFEPRFIFNRAKVYTYWQMDNTNGGKCQFMSRKDGKCAIHFIGKPFSCDFEPLKIRFYQKTKKVYIMKTAFGRGWQFITYDGRKGSQLEMFPGYYEDDEELQHHIDLFEELAYYSVLLYGDNSPEAKVTYETYNKVKDYIEEYWKERERKLF